MSPFTHDYLAALAMALGVEVLGKHLFKKHYMSFSTLPAEGCCRNRAKKKIDLRLNSSLWRWLQTMTISWRRRHPSTHPPHSSQSPTMRTISLHNPSATMPRGLRKHVWSGARSGAHNLLLTILTTSSEDVGDVSFTRHPFSSHPPDDILGSKTSGSTCSMKVSFVCNPVISISLLYHIHIVYKYKIGVIHPC